MKKLILIVMSLAVISGKAQENKIWRIGAQIGFNGSKAKYSGGMTTANARFNQSPLGANGINFIARYDYNNHWMGMTGIGFNAIGFQFSLSENYSLLKKDKQFSTIKSEFGTVEIPAMIFYKFNPNCKNVRWLVGAGFIETFIARQTIKKDFSKTNEGNLNNNYLSSESVSNSGGYWMVRWSIAREKMYKNGSILQASFIVNAGFRQIATSTVKYTVDNQNYEHTFSNSGNFAGFRIAYFLKPFPRSSAVKK